MGNTDEMDRYMDNTCDGHQIVNINNRVQILTGSPMCGYSLNRAFTRLVYPCFDSALNRDPELL